MLTKADLDAAIGKLTTTVSTEAGTIKKAFQTLVDKINAGAKPEDLTDEVAAINAATDALQGIAIPAEAAPADSTPAPAAS